MKNCEVVMIGGSAGSLEVLLYVLPLLSTTIKFAIIIVVHRKTGADNLLADLLSSKTDLPVREIEEKEKILRGTIYLAPADYHLLIEKDHTFSLDHSEKVNFSRPSIDVAFESAADVYKEALVCLLLSGSNADGVNGLKVVKHLGGKAVIQNPESAAIPYMPSQAKLLVIVDAILSIPEMAPYLNSL